MSRRSVWAVCVSLGPGPYLVLGLQVEGGPQFLAWGLGRQLAFWSWRENMVEQGASPSPAACGLPGLLGSEHGCGSCIRSDWVVAKQPLSSSFQDLSGTGGITSVPGEK